MSEDREKLDKLSENDELETEDNDVEAHSFGGRDRLGDEGRDVLGDEVLGDGERGRLAE